jgi:hypothetical protein
VSLKVNARVIAMNDRKDPYESQLIEKARRVMCATRLKIKLDAERLLKLAEKIDFFTVYPGSIVDGLIPLANDCKEFEKLRKKFVFAQSQLPEIAGRIEEDLEPLRCRVRRRKRMLEDNGPPEYVFTRLLGSVYKEFTGRKPGARDTGGPFERFVKEATRQFGQDSQQCAMPPSTTQIRRALWRKPITDVCT